MSLSKRLAAWPRERLAERLSAACYGTVLVLLALTFALNFTAIFLRAKIRRGMGLGDTA